MKIKVNGKRIKISKRDAYALHTELNNKLFQLPIKINEFDYNKYSKPDIELDNILNITRLGYG